VDKLSDALSEEQKDSKIADLLTNLRRKRRIQSTGSRAPGLKACRMNATTFTLNIPKNQLISLSAD
jgi:hypothetical protein